MDYGFTHQGKVYTPNGSAVDVVEVDARNAAIEQAELAHWQTRPDRAMGYFHFPAEDVPVLDRPNRQLWRDNFYPQLKDATIKTWLGTVLGVITAAHVYRHNMGHRFVSLTMRGTNGATYHGRASYDWGQCVNLRKSRGGRS